MNEQRGHLMIMAGGTGGHVFPALAVANVLREGGSHITWLGTRKGLEAKVVPANNIDLQCISVEGLRGKGPMNWLLAPLKMTLAIWQSIKVLRANRPDCVLGMGGFASGPGGLAAWLLRTPLVVHEQNAVAGLTNRYLAKLACRVLSGFPNVANLPRSAQWVGNPVRPSIKPIQTESPASPARCAVRVLVIGGSQGAHSFNVHLPRIFSALTQETDLTLEVWHQTGAEQVDAVTAEYALQKLAARCSEFIEDMAAAYQWADLLVCRAGAMTVAECCAAAKPSLLIPYPFSAGDHQTINAEFLVNNKAARMIHNNLLEGDAAVGVLQSLVVDRALLLKMGKAAHDLHKPDAISDTVSTLEEYLNA